MATEETAGTELAVEVEAREGRDSFDVMIIIDVTDMNIGDLERLESGSFAQILQVCDRVVRVCDPRTRAPLENQAEELRSLPWTQIRALARGIRDAVSLGVEGTDDTNDPKA